MSSPREFNNEAEMKNILSSYTFLLNVNDDIDDGLKTTPLCRESLPGPPSSRRGRRA